MRMVTSDCSGTALDGHLAHRLISVPEVERFIFVIPQPGQDITRTRAPPPDVELIGTVHIANQVRVAIEPPATESGYFEFDNNEYRGDSIPGRRAGVAPTLSCLV